MFCSLAAARRRLGVATGALLAVGVLAVPAGALAGVNADPGVYGDLYRMPSAPMPAPPRGADVTIGNLAFAAADVTISRGQSVTVHARADRSRRLRLPVRRARDHARPDHRDRVTLVAEVPTEAPTGIEPV